MLLFLTPTDGALTALVDTEVSEAVSAGSPRCALCLRCRFAPLTLAVGHRIGRSTVLCRLHFCMFNVRQPKDAAHVPDSRLSRVLLSLPEFIVFNSCFQPRSNRNFTSFLRKPLALHDLHVVMHIRRYSTSLNAIAAPLFKPSSKNGMGVYRWHHSETVFRMSHNESAERLVLPPPPTPQAISQSPSMSIHL